MEILLFLESILVIGEKVELVLVKQGRFARAAVSVNALELSVFDDRSFENVNYLA